MAALVSHRRELELPRDGVWSVGGPLGTILLVVTPGLGEIFAVRKRLQYARIAGGAYGSGPITTLAIVLCSFHTWLQVTEGVKLYMPPHLVSLVMQGCITRARTVRLCQNAILGG